MSKIKSTPSKTQKIIVFWPEYVSQFHNSGLSQGGDYCPHRLGQNGLSYHKRKCTTGVRSTIGRQSILSVCQCYLSRNIIGTYTAHFSLFNLHFVFAYGDHLRAIAANIMKETKQLA